MDFVELKALINKFDTRCVQGKLTEKLAASGSIVLAVDTSPEQVEIVRNTGLATHTINTKKWTFKCGSDVVFSKAVFSRIKIADLVNTCVNELFSKSGRFHASLQ
jgi:trans-aconitate methyltransferase